MHPSTSINLNINLIKFPIHPHNKHSITQNKQSNSNRNPSNSLTIKPNTKNLYYENMQDSLSSFQQFHPTMSTQSLCKAKRIYQKTIKSKTYSNHSIDQFYDLKINLNQKNNQQKHSKNNSNIYNSQQNKQKSHSSSRQSQNDKYLINKTNNLINKTNNSQKLSQNQSYNNSSSSTSSYQHKLSSKQPLNLLKIDCQDTFEEHQSNQFVQYGLFSQHFKKGSLTDKFKKKKSIKNQQLLKSKTQQENNKSKANQFKQSNNPVLKENKNVKQTSVNNQKSKHDKSHEKSKSKSKSRSKSKSKIQHKSSTQALRKLNFQKYQIKPQNQKSKITIKESRNRSKSKSPLKKSYDGQIYVKEPHLKNNYMKKQNSKSRSHSKSHKQFIRSKDHIQTNQNNLSPSQSARRKQNKSRSSIQKSKSRSRSNSQIKTFSNSKSKRSNQKSIKRNKLSHQKSRSPSLTPKQIAKKKYSVKEFNQKSTQEFNERKFSNSKQNKKSVSKEKIKKSNQHNKSKKSINQKQSLTVSKQIMVNEAQKSMNANKFSKNKSNRVTFAKTDLRNSPEHTKSTNFYHPDMKQKKEIIKKSNHNKSVQQDNKKQVSKISSTKKSKIFSSSKKMKNGEENFIRKAEKIINAVIKIQRVYRGYRVRKQLNEDLIEICKKVGEVRQKISDKKSKYWISSQDKRKIDLESDKKMESLSKFSINEFKNVINNKSLVQKSQQKGGCFEIILSQSNSIQNIDYSQQNSVNRSSRKQSSVHQIPQPTININKSISIKQDYSSFLINYPEQNSRSSLLPQDQIRYLQQLVSRDFELNRKLLKQNQQLKQHIRSISSQHIRSTDIWRDQRNKDMKRTLQQHKDGQDQQCSSQQQQGYNQQEQYQQQQQQYYQQQQQQAGQIQKNLKQEKPSKQDSLRFQKQSIQEQSLKKINIVNNQNKQISSTKKPQIFLINNNQQDHIVQNKVNQFQFFQPYSPKHYIVSPKHNPSPSLSKLVSPISNSSSLFNHQIPFSLQSPQNILQGEKRFNFTQESQIKRQYKNQDKKYFQAKNNKQQQNDKNLNDEDKNNFKEEDTKIKVETETDKRIQMLNKLFYEDKLLSPKTYQNKLNKLKQSTKPVQHKIQSPKHVSQQQKNITQSPFNQLNTQKQRLKVNDLIGSQDKQNQQTPIQSLNIRKVKLTQLTQNYNNNGDGQKISVSKALFKLQMQKDLNKENQFNKQKNNQDQQQQQENKQNQFYKQQRQQQHNQVQVDTDGVNFKISTNQQNIQPTQQSRLGFPTELLFIKNYIFQFFQFIKTHPSSQKTLLNNLLLLPFDNQHLLTCYRTQLQQIDSYYENKIQGQFLSYPYWKNLIDYQPVVTTQIFQQFSHMLESKRQSQQQEGYQWLGLNQDQQTKFKNKFGQRIGIKDLQRIFLMMLMDVFNEAFQQQRCSYKYVNLLRQQKGGMNNYSIICKALRKIKEIEQIQKSTPSYYLQSSITSQQQNELQNSTNHQFFLIHSLKRQKQQLVDMIFCSVLKRVLENWGRQMCGLIIQPQEQDQMQITIQQIQAKNTQRLCLALNKYVQQYEKEILNMMREHQVCTKLILTDRVLQTMLWQVIEEIVSVQQKR